MDENKEVDEKVEDKAQETKENVEEIKEEAKDKAEEVKENVKDKAEEVKEGVKDASEKVKDKASESFSQVKNKVKKKHPIRNFFIFLLVLIILLACAVFGLVYTKVIKLDYLKALPKYFTYKKVDSAYLNTLNEKNIKGEFTGSLEINRNEGEVYEEFKKYQEVLNETKLNISQSKGKDNELGKMNLNLNSYGEDVIDITAEAKKEEMKISEKALIDKVYNLKTDEVKEVIKSLNNSSKYSREMMKSLNELKESSFKIKGELAQIIDIEKNGSEYELSLHEDLNAKRFLEALETIKDELKEGKSRKALEKVVDNLNKFEKELSETSYGDFKLNENGNYSADRIIKNMEKNIEEAKNDDSFEEDFDKVLKELKKLNIKLTLEVENGKLSKTTLKGKMPLQEAGMNSDEKLELTFKFNANYKYGKDIENKLNEKLKGEAKDLNSKEEIEKELEELDKNKITEKLEKLKIVEKLGLKEMIQSLKDGKKENEIEEKRNEIFGDNNSRVSEDEIEELKKEIMKELEEESKNKNNENNNEEENKDKKENRKNKDKKDNKEDDDNSLDFDNFFN